VGGPLKRLKLKSGPTGRNEKTGNRIPISKSKGSGGNAFELGQWYSGRPNEGRPKRGNERQKTTRLVGGWGKLGVES